MYGSISVMLVLVLENVRGEYCWNWKNRIMLKSNPLEVLRRSDDLVI